MTKRFHARGHQSRVVLGLAAGLAMAWLMPATAQLAPRLSAQVALDELAAADSALGHAASGASLATVHAQLAAMAEALRAAMGSDALKPVELVGDALRARIVRAHAAAARVKAYVDASAGCLGGDALAMQRALADGVTQRASASESAKIVPAIDDVQTLKQQSLFAIHQGGDALSFALVGADLADAQCASPRVIATDLAGKALSSQPMLTGAVSGRIELRWPDIGALPVGSVVLRVAAEHKVFLLGCTSLPEARAVIQVVPAPSFVVDYALDAMCSAAGGATTVVALGHGTLPVLKGYGATVSQAVDTAACAEPQSYRLSAGVTSPGGGRTKAGPFTQSAQASITAGLPGGLTMRWNPSAQIVFVRTGAAVCKGVR